MNEAGLAPPWRWPPVPILLGLAMLLASYGWDNWRVFWSRGYNGQAPIVIAAAACACWLDFREHAAEQGGSGVAAGATLIAFALSCFCVGRAGEVYQLEGAAIPLTAAGLLLCYGGTAALRRLSLILILLLCAIPLPGSLADAALVPMKARITDSAVWVLAQAGYPISANGVVIYIGFAALQIADACSGLWSLLALIAVGLIYAYFVHFGGRGRVWLFIAAIPIIALLTNFLRVVGLTPVAYHFGISGEAAAHEMAAALELAVSLLMFIAWHAVLEIAPKRAGRS